MSTLIYDPDMTISVVDQSTPEQESDVPALDTALSSVYAGFTSKGRHNVIFEAKSPADLVNEFGDDFGNYSKFGLPNLMALNFARSGGRVFFCSLLPDDAKRAYSVFGVNVTPKSDIPVYERVDTIYSSDGTGVVSFGSGAFKLDASGNKIQCKVKANMADDTATELVTVEGVELAVTTKTLEDSMFDEDGEPTSYTGEPSVTIGDNGLETTFYPLFALYYFSNGKGGNDFAYTIRRYVARDRKVSDGRRYGLDIYKLLSTGTYAEVNEETYYFSFNPNAKYSEDSNDSEALSQVYINEDADGKEEPLQMIVYEENYAKLTKALSQFKDESETEDDIDFINGLFKSGIPYNKIVIGPDSIDTANTMITLDGGTDGSIDVGETINGTVITEEMAAEKKEELLAKFFNCDVDDDIFDEKITDIDYLFDADYSPAIKKLILGTFSKYRPDIALRVNVGKTTSYIEAINNANELAAYVNTTYSFMASLSAHYGTLTDTRVGSPIGVPDTYDLACSEADNFETVNGKFQMHAGANRGRVKYFRPLWVAKKNKSNMIEKLKDIKLNYVEYLNKNKDKVWGLETSQYTKENSKLCSNRNALVIGRAMRICHGILPYYKYDERDIDETLKSAKKGCDDALNEAGVPKTIGISTTLYQTKEDKRTENAHCDITFTFPDYAKTFTVTIIAKRPSTNEAQ